MSSNPNDPDFDQARYDRLGELEGEIKSELIAATTMDLINDYGHQLLVDAVSESVDGRSMAIAAAGAMQGQSGAARYLGKLIVSALEQYATADFVAIKAEAHRRLESERD